MRDNKFELATIGGGCFWCVEAIFQEINGVEKVVSGYSGGNFKSKPTYEEICTGQTGFAEVIQITYDATIISYESILIIFMTTHDPTSLNRQGLDEGTQYRSVIYFHNNEQKIIAETVLKEIAPYFDKPIVTEISPLDIFYVAEEYHQNYYRNHLTQGYCNVIISPKLTSMRKMHADRLKRVLV